MNRGGEDRDVEGLYGASAQDDSVGVAPAFVDESRLLKHLVLSVAQAPDTISAMATALREICRATGWDYGEAWLPEADDDVLALHPVWHTASLELSRFETEFEGTRWVKGQGLPGRVWASRAPEWLHDLTDSSAFVRAAAAARTGFQAGLGVPVLAGDDVVAVVVFFTRHPRPAEEQRVGLVNAALAPLGPVIQRMRAEEALKTLNRTLERRVAERTAELEQSNADLRAEIAKRASFERELRSSEAKLKRAQTLAGLGSFELSLDTAAQTHWSDEACRILGIGAPASSMTTSGFVEAAVHGDDRARVALCFEQAVLARKPFDIEYRVEWPNGDVRTVFNAGRPLYKRGRPVKLACTVLDVTERRDAEQALLEYRNELAHLARVATVGELATGLAHELNQPLSAISHTAQACLRWLQSGRTDQREILEQLQHVSAEARRASEIVRRLREYLRKRTTQHTRVDLNAVVEDTLRLLERSAQQAGVRVNRELAQPLPSVTADEIQIGQVILNVVRNAIEALADDSGPQRVISITTSHAADTVLMEVEDSGPGIGRDDLGKVFEPFFTTRTDGLGMGLAISRTLVEACGGTLVALPSPGSSRGVTFRLSLPVMSTQE